MPSWLVLLLLVVGTILVVAMQAAGVTGSWRVVWRASRQFGLYLLVPVAVAALIGVIRFIWS